MRFPSYIVLTVTTHEPEDGELENLSAPFWQKRINDECYSIIVLHEGKEFEWQVRVSRPDLNSEDGCDPDDVGRVLGDCKGRAKTKEEALKAARACLNTYLTSIGKEPI